MCRIAITLLNRENIERWHENENGVIKSKYDWFSKQNMWLSRSRLGKRNYFHALLLKLPSGTFCTHCDFIATVNVQNPNPPSPRKKNIVRSVHIMEEYVFNRSTNTRTEIFQQEQRKPRFKDPKALILLTTLRIIITMSSSLSSTSFSQVFGKKRFTMEWFTISRSLVTSFHSTCETSLSILSSFLRVHMGLWDNFANTVT